MDIMQEFAGTTEYLEVDEEIPVSEMGVVAVQSEIAIQAVAEAPLAPVAVLSSRTSELPAPSRNRQKTRGARESSAEIDPVRTYLKEIGKIKLLTPEEEIDLATKVKQGLTAAVELKKAEAEGRELSFEERRKLTRLQAQGATAKQEFV